MPGDENLAAASNIASPPSAPYPPYPPFPPYPSFPPYIIYPPCCSHSNCASPTPASTPSPILESPVLNPLSAAAAFQPYSIPQQGLPSEPPPITPGRTQTGAAPTAGTASDAAGAGFFDQLLGGIGLEGVGSTVDDIVGGIASFFGL